MRVLALACTLGLGSALAAPGILVAYPPENYAVAYDHVLFEGSVTPGADLSVNGQTLQVSPDGLFIAWLPLRPGGNSLRLVSRLGVERTARTFRVIRRAPPDHPNKLRPLPAPRVAEVTAPDLGGGINPITTAGLALDGETPVFFPKTGERLGVVGENDRFYKVQLAPDLFARLPRGAVRLLPAGTPRTAFKLGNVRVSADQHWTEVRLPLSGRPPFIAEQTLQGGASRLDLRLFQMSLEPDAGIAGLPGALVQNAQVVPSPSGELRLRLDLAGVQPWGYTASYQGNDLVLRLKRPPEIDAARPLSGRRVVLDAGHGGKELGGAGSLGLPEKALTLSVTLQLAARLRALGAEVILTRTGDVTVPLYDRPLLAEDAGADVLLSVHANAIPDGVDPATRHGAGVYTFQPQAAPLARALLAALNALVPEAGQDRGGLFWRSLALTRPTSQPSVLVELAYLTTPDGLRLLMDPRGQARFADALARGLENFFAAGADAAATP